MHSRFLRLSGFIRNTRSGVALAAAVVVLVFSAIPAYFVLDYGNSRQRYLMGEAERHLNGRMLHAQTLLDRAKTMPEIVALTISQAGSPSRFEGTIRNLLVMSGIVESVNIASIYGPATVVHRDPRDQKGPVAVLFPPARMLVIDNKPFVGFGDGSLLMREAFSEVGSGNIARFWGYVTIEASFAYLIQELQLVGLVNDGFGVSLGVQWQSGVAETVIFTGGNHSYAGASRSLPLPGSARLTLTVVPPQAPLGGFQGMAWGGLLLVDVLLFLLTFHLLRRPQFLEREVEARTQEIAAEKVALKNEIAARIKAESYLERSHGLLDSIFEHIPGMIVLKRVSDRRIVRVNRSGERMLGRSRDLLAGRSNEEIYEPELADFLTQGDCQALAQPGLLELPIRCVEMPAAAPRWISYSKTVLRDRDGAPQYILEFGEDLTERENLDRRLMEQLHFREQLIEAFPGPVFSKDVAGRYLAVNVPFEEFIGKPRGELIGKTVFDIAPEHLAREYDAADRALLDAGGKQVYESQVKVADGSVVETMFHKAVFRASDGSKAGIVGIALDISARKNAERTVAHLNRILMVLSEINHLIIRTRESDSLLSEARRILQEKGGFPAVWIHVRRDRTSEFIADPSMRIFAARICDEIENHERRCWPERRLHCDELVCCNPGLAEELRARGLQSLIHLPLRSGDIDWGDIGILGSLGQSFSTEEQSLLEELAGNLSFALGAMHQDERRRQAESKFELSARILENNSEGIFITDGAGRILMVNKAFSTVTGYSADEAIGQTPALLRSGRHDTEFFNQMWRTLEQQGEWRGEVINRRKNGEEFPEWLSISLVRNDAGQVTNHVAVFSDLTARREMEQRVEFLAHYDSLTALPNRAHFGSRVAAALVTAKDQGKQVAVVFFDLDRFKLINETAGQVVADQVLVEVSSRLLAEAKNKLDVARVGGDQFAVLIPGLDSMAQAAHFVQRLQGRLAQPFPNLFEQDIHVSASIGISVFPEDGGEAETLVRNADSAMYRAIEDGGNTYRFFRQEMNERAAERVQLESRLHHAIEHGDLEVHFQPFVAAASGRIAGAEALLRWHCAALGGYVSPAVFIPILEEIGLIRQVGEWVLNQACAQLRRWNRLEGGERFVAVNISAMQLTDDLPGIVAKVIADHGIAPEQLEIELTESAIMRDTEHGICILHELKALGIKLSIDDFGTGYSSLSYLKRLPMTTLKIDRSFVLDIPVDAEAVSITRAIMALGHALHLHIIAEGVETPEQVGFLCHIGCDLLQGYYFSKAVSAAEFIRLLTETPVFALPANGQRTLHLLRDNRLQA